MPVPMLPNPISNLATKLPEPLQSDAIFATAISYTSSGGTDTPLFSDSSGIGVSRLRSVLPPGCFGAVGVLGSSSVSLGERNS